MIVLGLTGSIGMGKSTTAKMFSDFGVPVHDSDEAVHRLYRGKAAPLVEAAFPGTTADGMVDRSKLAQRVLSDPAALKRLEALVHPLVRADATASSSATTRRVRRWRSSTYRFSTRPAVRSVSTRSWW